MELQLALDNSSLEVSQTILKEVYQFVDIIEIGTPLIISEGTKAIREIKEMYPNKKVLADLKIMDAGKYETSIAIEAGADIVSVLGVSDNLTIKNSFECAKSMNREVMVDLINVADIKKRMKELIPLGVDYFCVHAGTDSQEEGNDPLEELKLAKKVSEHTKVAVAGGITLDKVPLFIAEQPNVIIVGGEIVKAMDKSSIAEKIKRKMTVGEFK